MNISIVTLPYNTEGKCIGGGAGPKVLLETDLVEEIEAQGHNVVGPHTVELSSEEESRYGGWNRVGLANGRLAELANGLHTDNNFILGLLANCNGVLGLLGGLQQNPMNPKYPKRVGLVWIDAHGDYNTPETSPSGMLGGMPVAVAAGKALHRLRHQSGMALPLQAPDILMMGLRDLDDMERDLIAQDNLVTLNEQDLIDCSEQMHRGMLALSDRQDIIYVHVDLDILDPSVAPAAGLPSTGGLTGEQLGNALATLLKYPKVQALALVSYKPERDDAAMKTRDVVKKAILLATEGLRARN